MAASNSSLMEMYSLLQERERDEEQARTVSKPQAPPSAADLAMAQFKSTLTPGNPEDLFEALLRNRKHPPTASVSTGFDSSNQRRTTTFMASARTPVGSPESAKVDVSIKVATENVSSIVAEALARSAPRAPHTPSETELQSERDRLFAEDNRLALDNMPAHLRTYVTEEAARLFENRALSGLWVYPNTAPNAEARSFTQMPKLAGYTAHLAGSASIIDMLAFLNLRVSSKVLVQIEHAIPDLELRVEQLKTQMTMRQEQTHLDEVRSLIARVNAILAEKHAPLLDTDHLPRTPMQIHYLSRVVNKIGMGAVVEHYLLLDIIDVSFVGNINRMTPVGAAWTEPGSSKYVLDRMSSVFMKVDQHQQLAMTICRELRAIPMAIESAQMDCGLRPLPMERAGCIVKHHVYQWTGSEAHYYPIVSVSRSGDTHYNVVGIQASPASIPDTRAHFATRHGAGVYQAARNCLASLPFMEAMVVDEIIEWKRQPRPDVQFIHKTRDILCSLPKPFFPKPNDQDELARRPLLFINQCVLETYNIIVYDCLKAVAMGLDPEYITITEGIMYGDGVVVPFHNEHYSKKALEQIGEILQQRNLTNQERLRQTLALLSTTMQDKPVATYNARLLTNEEE